MKEMTTLYCIVSVLSVIHFQRCFGFVSNIYNPAECIGCYKTASLEYFNSLNQIWPDCATKEKADFATIPRRAYIVTNICENHYVTGNIYKEKFPEMQTKGSAALAAYKKCQTDDKSFNDDKKANIKTFTIHFDEDRAECGDVKYLENDIKYFRDLSSDGSTAPPAPGANGLTSQDQAKTGSGPTPSKDCTNTAPDNKPPPANPIPGDASSKDNNSASKDPNNTTQGNNPPSNQTDTTKPKNVSDAAKENQPSNDPKNITPGSSSLSTSSQSSATSAKDSFSTNEAKGNSNPSTKDPDYKTQGNNSPPVNQSDITSSKDSTDTRKGNGNSPNNTALGGNSPLTTNSNQNNTTPSKDQNNPSSTNPPPSDPNKNNPTPKDTNTTSQNTTPPPDKNISTNSQATSSLSSVSAQNTQGGTAPPPNPSQNSVSNTPQTADQGSPVSLLPDPGALLNSFIGYSSGTNTFPNSQQNVVSSSASSNTSLGNQMNNSGATSTMSSSVQTPSTSTSTGGNQQLNLGFGQGSNWF